ncbi:MAG: hypothetical protein WCI77_02625 [Candidatus Omnitrophota bacterium]
MDNKIKWPHGKNFAFTIFDDTDNSTIANTRDVYAFLYDCGFLTTKSVWVFDSTEKSQVGKEWTAGDTCDDKEYVQWLKDLQSLDFEIGLHSVSTHRSRRDRVIYGIERFRDIFGYYPQSASQHLDYRENESMYWGNRRVSGFNEYLYNTITLNRFKGKSKGHIEKSEYFWGDICKQRIKFMRNFVFSDINTLKTCPVMPYHDDERPYVNYWFASSEGRDLKSYIECIKEKNQDNLEASGGACIVYTHFASGFFNHGKLDCNFKFLMERLSKKNGWFVPVSTLLDYLLRIKGHQVISNTEKNRLERKWLWHKIRHGTT